MPMSHRLTIPALALLATATAIPASAAEPENQPNIPSRTRGHAQVGLAIFDRSGTLAAETDARGFAPFGGGTLRLGFVHNLGSAPWLGFGGGVRGTFGNSRRGDEEYFFNPIFTSATVAGFIPLGPGSSGRNLALDVGMTNALAKRRRQLGDGTEIFHEYGIGPGLGWLVGYRLDLGVATAPTVSVQYSRHWVGVEENGGTSKTWALGTTVLLLGMEL